jgi:hypothetical protein
VTAERCSTPSGRIPSDTARGTPSEDTTTACATSGTRSVKSVTSQLRSCVWSLAGSNALPSPRCSCIVCQWPSCGPAARRVADRRAGRAALAQRHAFGASLVEAAAVRARREPASRLRRPQPTLPASLICPPDRPRNLARDWPGVCAAAVLRRSGRQRRVRGPFPRRASRHHWVMSTTALQWGPPRRHDGAAVSGREFGTSQTLPTRKSAAGSLALALRLPARQQMSPRPARRQGLEASGTWAPALGPAPARTGAYWGAPRPQARCPARSGYRGSTHARQGHRLKAAAGAP